MPAPASAADHRPLRVRAVLTTLAALLFLVATPACTSIETQHRDWSTYEGPGEEWFQIEEPEFFDPMADEAEPFNRAMFAVNDAFMRWIISPLGKGWRFILPAGVRDAIERFGTNLAFPVRGLNNLVQGEGGAAGRETGRFLVNTTVGLLGFFDVATPMGIEAADNDTGRSFAAAGWDEPRFLTLPGIGPTSTRDGVGFAGDTVLNIGFWLWPVGMVTGFNFLAGSVEGYKRLVEQRADAYELSRYAWSVLRLQQVVDLSFDMDEDSGSAKETLNSIFLTYDDPEFLTQCEVREVMLPGRDEPLPYDVWLQDDPAPMVYLVPGLGSHRSVDSAVALAELFFEQGWSVATISSAMHPEFMRGGLHHPLPGYGPLDAAAVREALAAVDSEMTRLHPGAVTRRVMAGVSLGAFHSLLVAAGVGAPAEGLDDGLVLDGFLALDTPVDLLHGVERLDGFYRTPMEFPAEEREQRINNIFLKIVHLLQGESLTPGTELPFDEWEAEYLIGVSFRLSLVGVIFDSQIRHDRGVLATPLELNQRGPAYREIVRYSFMEYVYAWLLPSLQERGTLSDDDSLFTHSRLQHWSDELRGRDDVRVVVNADDFLNTDTDRAWLVEQFGADHVTLRPMGGHLGNLWEPDVQQDIVDRLAELLED
jgi:ABC-type transporter lipoprotein component MlaA